MNYCIHCKYHTVKDECRRFAPNPSWPKVKPFDWCGEAEHSLSYLFREWIKHLDKGEKFYISWAYSALKAETLFEKKMLSNIAYQMFKEGKLLKTNKAGQYSLPEPSC